MADEFFQTHDSQGRTVVCLQERWKHIIEGHPELLGREADIAETIRDPFDEEQDARDQRRICYFRPYIVASPGFGHWLKVVVEYRRHLIQTRGTVITAYCVGARKRKV
jgi:hypothetical protein